MYGNLYAGRISGRMMKSEGGLIKVLVFCIIAGLLFLTGYENYRIMQRILAEIQDGSIPESAVGRTMTKTGEGKRERKIRIVLDAGHGGKDAGSSYGGICEKDINYEVVRDLQKILESMGAEVILSRNGDTFVTEYKRIGDANDKKADLFISIHCDCGRETAGAPGLECYYDGNGYLGKEYADNLMTALKQNSGIKCTGIRQGDFYVLKNADMPAILIKLGSLSNPEDRRKLTETACREQETRKLAECIMQLFYR